MERTVKSVKPNLSNAPILVVRREVDHAASTDVIPGSLWENPEQIGEWIAVLAGMQAVVIYCAHGGLSNCVVDRPQAKGIRARYAEGGIEARKAAGGRLAAR